MSENILNSYLVRLGFDVDNISFAKFSNALKDASSLVDHEFINMAKGVVGFQATVVGAFASIASATIGFADKAAQADQDYRLLALHMYTSLPVARELKVALDALGQPLENVMWDPELAGRFHQLVKDQQTMTEQLGPNFEAQMLKIRDVRFEFTRLGVEVQYFGMFLVNDLAKAFGTSISGMEDWLRRFNDYIITNMPYLADWFAKKLKPILIETKDVLIATFNVMKAIGADLANFPLEKFIKDVSAAVIALSNLEEDIARMYSATSKALHGDFKGAVSELSLMPAIVGGHENDKPPSANAGGVLSGAGAGFQSQFDVNYIKQAIADQARSMGIDPAIALALVQHESNFRQFNYKGEPLLNPTTGATGLMQLLPSTALRLGVDPNDMGQNLTGGLTLFKELMKQYGDPETALAHYEGKGGAESYKNADEILKAASQINVNIYAKTDASAQDIAMEVDKVLRQRVTQPAQLRTQRTIAQFQTLGSSY